MKHVLTLLFLCGLTTIQAQVFSGKGDQKMQVGMSLQSKATGILLTYDVGLGENISVGVATGYALGIGSGVDKAFADRYDLKARFNANIGNVLKIDDNLDVYPGLSLSLKNFGTHLGARYFFTNGFGIFTESGFPLAKYKTSKLSYAEKIHNQFYINLGVAFNL